MTQAAHAVEIRFSWRGIDAEGRLRRGRLRAANAELARAHLQRERIVVLALHHRGAARCRALRGADVTRFSRQLAGLLQAGLPLVAALELIAASQGRPHLARVVGELARDLLRGLRFAAALERHPDSFGPLYCQLIALGEASASLAATLTRLADDRERAAGQQARLRAALAYPLGVLLLALVITAALMIWVVPTFEQIFSGVGAALPAPTRLVLALSDATARAALPVSGAILLAVLLARQILRRSRSWRLLADAALLRAPFIGGLLRQLCVARWSRALGTLLAAGTPLADALDALTRATGNTHFDRASARLGPCLRRGERLAKALRASGCFPADVIQPIAVAEESGTLDAMLADLAALNDRQVDERIGSFASLVEPLIIVVLGALIGGLVVAMYLPIIQLGNVV